MRSAGSDPVVGDEALTLLRDVDEFWVAKGRKVLRHDLRDARPDDDTLLGLLLGRSGKLRAPVLRSGRRLLVGYNEELLEDGL